MNLSVIFKALGDDTRMRMLSLLSQSELCECQLCLAMNIPQPNASKHLKCLRYAGVITCRKRSQWCFYRLSENFTRRYSELYAFLLSQWQTEAPFAEDSQRLFRVLRTKRCCGMDLSED